MSTPFPYCPPVDAQPELQCALEPGIVHVWRVPTDRAPRETEQLYGLMSEDERERADRFLIDRDRTRFIGRRGLLRVLLARYVERDPAALAFKRNPFGKPTLCNNTGRLQFNASHSDGVALVAVTVDRAVGIDIERHRLEVDCLVLADRFFAPDEAEVLRRANQRLRRAMFFTLWCCKEAWVKAKGVGLSWPLRRCRVSLGDGAPRLLEDSEDSGHSRDHERWSVTQLAAGPEYSAALVVESPTASVPLLRFVGEWPTGTADARSAD